MNPRAIFVAKYSKLVETLEHGSPTDVLLLSATLRHLLLDQSALIHQANRGFNLKITFSIPSIDTKNALQPKNGIPAPSLFWFGEYEPNMGPCRPVKLAEFLSWNMLLIGKEVFSVRDIIDTCANKFGGVHSNEPVNDDHRTKLLRFWSESIRLGKLNIALQTVRGASTYVRDAIRPLYDKCAAAET